MHSNVLNFSVSDPNGFITPSELSKWKAKISLGKDIVDCRHNKRFEVQIYTMPKEPMQSIYIISPV